LQQKKKSAKAVQRDSSGDSVKTHRQASEVSRESYVTRPNHDVSTNVSKQRSDYAEDIRTPSHHHHRGYQPLIFGSEIMSLMDGCQGRHLCIVISSHPTTSELKSFYESRCHIQQWMYWH